LIETAKDSFFPEFLERLKTVIHPGQIDYLVLNHTEPDHTGSVVEFLKLAPNATVVASPIAHTFLAEIANQSVKKMEVKGGDSISLGDKTLRFIDAPFLHWPDSMYTYCPEDKVLFTCDSFGSHYSSEEMFDDLITEDYSVPFKYYFDNIIGPYKSYMIEALDKIKDLPIDVICPGHGPILRTNLDKIFATYREWSAPAVKGDKPLVLVPYVSAYGYTKSIAEMIIDGVSMMGDFDIRSFDLVETPVADVIKEVEAADALLIGSPTIVGDALPPIWQLLNSLSPVVHGGKLAGACGSYGWSGEAVPNIEARLKSLRMQVVPGIKINFKPSEPQLEKAYEWGVNFGRKLVDFVQPKSKTSWRCLVCGQVFQGEEPPEVCPACGVTKDNFVRVLAEDEFINDTSDTYVIAGGGIAALTAAEAIRKRDRTGTIKIYSEEPFPVYYRTALAKVMVERPADEELMVHSADWFKEHKIEMINSAQIVSVDLSGRKINLEDGSAVPYSRLIVATGSRSNIPPIPGNDLEGVFALRSLKDADRIREYSQGRKKAVIIGGGVLGLEAAFELHEGGFEVNIVEYMPRLMPRQLDQGSSSWLQDALTKVGINLYLEASTAEIAGDGKVSSVKLTDGREIPCDLVLLSTGVKPNVELAKEAGISVNKGIVVDSSMRTSASDVFACGDVAEFNETVVGLWSIAGDMARVAGANAAGDWLEYDPPKLSTLLAVFDKEIFSVGEVNLTEKECRIVEINDPNTSTYKKFFMQDGVLIGAIIIAPKVKATAALRAIGKGAKPKANKWKCRRCGYIHEGSEPPDVCPVCGVPKNMFDPVE
ncbi:MAG: FAD-dependent oxidoreductase, partial [Syntrophomonadaceae bacterium]|nr:FAD-dependent oxidoreductase [Syntrophomonadaceae bacterium]